MIMIRAFGVLCAGFMTLLLAMGVSTVLMSWLLPVRPGTYDSGASDAEQSDAEQKSHPKANSDAAAAFIKVGFTFLSGAAGGFVTATFAAANPLIHALALALIVLLLSAMSAIQTRAQQPLWQALAELAIAPVGVFVGGGLSLRISSVL